MARNTTTKKIEEAPADVPGDVPPMKGGTLGVVTTQTRPSALPTGMVGKAREVIRDSKPARTFEVVQSPGSVMYGSCRTRLPVGKVVSEASCDLDMLRRQGVHLQEILPEVVTPVETGTEAT